MTSATLWLEITIAGFPFLIAIFFLLLRVLNIYDLKSIAPDKDYMPYISVGAVAASYILGILAHRLTQIILPITMQVIKGDLKNVNKSSPGSDLPDENSTGKLTVDMPAIWQRGSERLNKEIDIQFALFALLRSLTISLPVLGTSLTIWLCEAHFTRSWVPITFSLVMAIACWFACRRQRQYLNSIREAASKIVNGGGTLQTRDEPNE